MKKRFQECGTPRIAWQFNSLAHTVGFASILAQSMYDMLFMFKLDRSERDERRESQQLEFMWRSGGERILVSVPYGIDSLPAQFNFDTNWYPISQEELDSGATVDFIRYVQKVARSYATNHVYVLMGKDFCFRNAEIHFHSIENLMAAVEEYANTTSKTPVNIFYSSPNCYMKSLYESGRVWSSYSDGFVSNSESSERDTFQSGFFTSRASIKHEIRKATNYLETVKQLAVLSGELGRQKDPAVRRLRFLLSLAMQTKFVAGVSSQQVSTEFQQTLRQALVPVIGSIATTFNRMIGQAEGHKPEAGADEVRWNCWLVNGHDDSCRQSISNDTRIPSPAFILFADEQKQQEEIRIFNPLSRSAVQIIRLPVPAFDQTFIVMSWQGYDLQYQLLPIHPEFISLSSSASYSSASNAESAVDQSTAAHELVFKAILPAMGFTSFVIRKRLNDQQGRNPIPLLPAAEAADASISNEYFRINYDAVTGAMRSLKLLSMNQTITFANKWIEYESGDKSNHYALDGKMKSGRDLSEGAKLVRVVRGPVVQEIHVTISPLISHVIRVYRDREEIECDWIIRPSADASGKGKELFLRIQSEPLLSNYFMTDSNCKEPVKRSLNTFIRKDSSAAAPQDESDILASNLFPVNCFIAVQDGNLALAVMPDRPEAGTSISAGRIDLLVHRSTSAVPYGSLVPEPLSENSSFRGRHRIFLSRPARVTRQVVLASKAVLKAPIVFVRDKSSIPPKGESSGLESSCLASSKIPAEINILSLEPGNDGKALIRVENVDYYGSGNDVTFCLKDAFTCIKISKAQEMTLTATSDYLEAKRKQLKWKESEFDETSPVHTEVDASLEIKLRPGEIRTFILWLDE